MILDVYIGELDDPFLKWEGGDHNGNVPHFKLAFPYRDKWEAFWRVVRKIETGEFLGKQTDWAGWVAKVNKIQIAGILRELNEGEGEASEPLALLTALEDGRLYALVAVEC